MDGNDEAKFRYDVVAGASVAPDDTGPGDKLNERLAGDGGTAPRYGVVLLVTDMEPMGDNRAAVDSFTDAGGKAAVRAELIELA
jgi:hypothetical protein